MSIRVMTQVWDHSTQKGSALLLLLALADHAADDGFCWPGFERLAQKIRMSTRSVSRLIDSLEQDREIFVIRQKGAHNWYIVRVGMADEDVIAVLKKRKLDTPDNLSLLTPVSSGHDIAVSESDDMAVSDEPSLPVNESSLDSPPGVPPQKPKPTTKTKKKAPPHPAIKVYQREFHTYPRKETWKDIIAAVGDDPERLKTWARVCHQWLMKGYYKFNITGLVECFHRGGVRSSGSSTPRKNGKGEQGVEPRIAGTTITVGAQDGST